MADTYIRDRQGTTLGRLTTERSGRIVASDRNGRMLGYYDPKADRTYERLGRFLAQGNICAALIVENSQK